ncbi:MAG TPA: hypothetical protein PKD45_07760 [Flavobacteriales bacterium]|nr:hypothetical protein [Flavobacteriales bacterium]
MNSTDIFFAIGRFIEWSLGVISAPEWGLPIAFISVILFGMLYWLYWQRKYTSRAKERNEFI